MAQHYSIINDQSFSKISDAIKKRFSKGLVGMRTSMIYQELDTSYKFFENERVFMTSRIIKKEREHFEIHYDTVKKEVYEIFLVKWNLNL